MSRARKEERRLCVCVCVVVLAVVCGGAPEDKPQQPGRRKAPPRRMSTGCGAWGQSKAAKRARSGRPVVGVFKGKAVIRACHEYETERRLLRMRTRQSWSAPPRAFWKTKEEGSAATLGGGRALRGKQSAGEWQTALGRRGRNESRASPNDAATRCLSPASQLFLQNTTFTRKPVSLRLHYHPGHAILN